jgi:ankyrin repeat protein
VDTEQLRMASGSVHKLFLFSSNGIRPLCGHGIYNILENGAVVNAADTSGRTPLHWALEFNPDSRFFMLGFLLENGADVNMISNDGLSPLQRALNVECGADVVALLLEHGADVTVLSRKERRLLPRLSRTSRANRRANNRRA